MFKDAENSNAHLEPCEMTAHHNRMALDKLATYEDADEQGLLLRLPCNKVWFICDKGTKYATIMSKDIDDLTGYEVRKIDRDGRYWSTKEKAEAELEK